MTDTAYIEALREEGIDIDDLEALPFIERHYGGYSVNTSSESKATMAIEGKKYSGGDFRVHVYATNVDGTRYEALINEGRDNGIGADRLQEMLIKEGVSLSGIIEDSTHGKVKADEIAFYQLEFEREHHRR
jgi:hypothetical protein